MIKALIINFNRISLPVKLALWCANHGLEPVFIDNNSDYPPLLKYYHSRCPFTVMHMNKNYGHTVVWNPETTIFQRLGITGPYIVTDPDLDLSGIPDDFLSVLEAGLIKYPQFDKCGFSLEINNIKNQGTIDWETPFWQHPLDDMYFNAAIDTTFALYKTPVFSYNAIRTNRPYTAVHVPWMFSDLSELPEDEQYYFNTQNENTKSHSHLTGRDK